jgi:peptidyl-prolyl cis-trans isomerase D
MFEFFRSHNKLMLGLLLLLVFPSFVFFGLESYTRMRSDDQQTVASVDGRKISRAEWDAAHRQTIERMRQQAPNLDAKLFDTPQAKRETLDGIVRERVLLASAERQALLPGDTRLQNLFWNDPNLAMLRSADGKSLNREMLAAQGLTEATLVQRLRVDYGMRQVLGGVQNTAVAPARAASAGLSALMQRREVQMQRFDAVAYLPKVNPSDADLEAYYKANEAQFRAAEQAEIEYVVLDIAALSKGITLTREGLEKFYSENLSRYTAAEERRASHILITADKDAPADKRKEARTKAESLLADVRKAPGSFAEVARQHSQDPGSAAKGGDLEFFGRGAMVKPFEDAVYALKPGEISNVVESDFGYHIIQLTSVRGGQRKPFEEVRAEIEAEVRRQEAQRLWAEKAEQFTNTVFEQADSLQPVVDKLKLEARRATVQRQPAAGAQGALASAKLLEAVFAQDAVVGKKNTQAVDIGTNQLAAARVLVHSPARTLPLAEVRDRVRQRVAQSQAFALARQEGQARLAAVQAKSDEALPMTATLSRADGRGPQKAVVDAVLAAPADKLPAVVGVALGEQGFVVAKVLRIVPSDAPPEALVQMRQQVTQAWGEAEGQAYLEALKRRFKAEVKPAAAAAASAVGS